MLQKKLFVVLFFAAVFFVNQQSVYACSCAAKPTVLDSFERSELVIAARVVSVEKIREKKDKYDIEYIKSTKMVVEKVYKGNVKVGDELTFGQGGGSDCIWTFDEKYIGLKFLFYLGKPSKGRWFDEDKDENAPLMYYAVTCGRSKGFDYAFDDLAYLNNIEKVRGKTRISGTFDSWHTKENLFGNLKIKIIGEKKTYEAKTDENGFFEIYDLPADFYAIEPQMPKGWKLDTYSFSRIASIRDYDKSKNQILIRLEEKRHASLDLLFTFANAIRGKVISPSGKPMEGVSVKAVSTELKEGDYRGQWGRTNEKGEYEIDELPVGSYILVVNADGKIDDDQPFGTLFFPGVAEFKNAAVLTLENGKILSGINIQIPKTVELIEIKGRFVYSDGAPVIDERVKFTPLETAVYDEVSARTDAEGRFMMKIPKGASGKLSGEFYTNSRLDDAKKCPNLMKVIKASGNDSMTVKSEEVEISANESLTEVKVTIAFPCNLPAKD